MVMRSKIYFRNKKTGRTFSIHSENTVHGARKWAEGARAANARDGNVMVKIEKYRHGSAGKKRPRRQSMFGTSLFGSTRDITLFGPTRDVKFR